jgi:hypothetical protein
VDLISNDTLALLLRAEITRHGGPSLYARRLGVSCAFISRMAKGERHISGRILEDLGYERALMFRRVRQERDMGLD